MDAAGLSITVAGSVLKLVAVSIDFVTDARQVYQNGSIDLNRDLAVVANDVQNATVELEKQLDEFKGKAGRGSMDSVNEDLHVLADRATKIGNELASRLKRVQTDPESKWKSLKTTILGRWDAKDIETVEKRLDKIRSEMQLRILVDIRGKVGVSQGEHHRMLSTLESVAHSLAESKKDRNIILEILGRLSALQLSVERQLASRNPSLGPAAGYSRNQPDGISSEEAEKAILRILWYPSMDDREESIQAPYSETLHWIYQGSKMNSKGDECEWDSFVDFLRGEKRMYWITGKPGSGKSTLMKFIKDQPQTKQLLKQWTGDRRLLSASFYFFYKGSDEQKSELGLLRSLLHLILSQRRDLIRKAFEERFMAALGAKQYAEPTLDEAKRALQRILQDQSPHQCFFLTIDGLDEFDPKVSMTSIDSLIALTKMLESFENVKVIVSSRQLPRFEHVFKTRPHLKIHELTRDDIKHYAEERLERDPGMQRLIRQDPIDSRTLIKSIASMSSGVFLWVRVVTESLLRGLTDGDNIHDLQQRLEGLPSDLEELYGVMLLRVEQGYRSQTCKLLQLVYYGTKDPMELSVIGLWFAERADHGMVFRTDTTPISEEDLRDRVNEMDSRLKSRCLGLVEICGDAPAESKDAHSILSQQQVCFLHKTVVEFLEGQIWAKFIEAHCPLDFDHHMSLFRSAILVIKTCTPVHVGCWRSYGSHSAWVTIGDLIYDAVDKARRLDDSSVQANSNLLRELLHEFDSTVAIHFRKCTRHLEDTANLMTSHWSLFLEVMHLRGNLEPTDTHPDFLSLAIRCGWDNYVEEQIKTHGRDLLKKEGLSLLGYTIYPILYREEDQVNSHNGFQPRAHIVRLLLETGHHPEQSFEGLSMWAVFWETLHELYSELIHSSAFPEAHLHLYHAQKDALCVLRLLVESGAEPNILVLWTLDSEYRQSYCTPRVALTRIRVWLLDAKGWKSDELLVEIEILIQLFKERGGIDKEISLGEWNEKIREFGKRELKVSDLEERDLEERPLSIDENRIGMSWRSWWKRLLVSLRR
ncbi:hypothetical protein F4677DRAFT_463278 [Hypoxylon crocopeplum]|nr:hypothetical protein F4677DRAFT_463278 [Hypoxylon crocopeplum]